MFPLPSSSTVMSGPPWPRAVVRAAAEVKPKTASAFIDFFIDFSLLFFDLIGAVVPAAPSGMTTEMRVIPSFVA
jgi:hypothetical protein